MAGCIVMGVSLSRADIIAPGYRGQPRTTFADWRFSTAAQPVTAEFFTNPEGNPTADVQLEPTTFPSGWWDEFSMVFGAAQGFWDVGRGGASGGSIMLDDPHPVSATTAMLSLMVQVVYWDDISDIPTVEVPGGTMVGSPVTSLILSGPSGGAWMAQRTEWTVAPGWNPANLVKVDADPTWGSVIDRVVLDTLYEVPEPLSAGLCLLGGVVAMAVRRRRI
jgi:hypothetical protein